MCEYAQTTFGRAIEPGTKLKPPEYVPSGQKCTVTCHSVVLSSFLYTAARTLCDVDAWTFSIVLE